MGSRGRDGRLRAANSLIGHAHSQKGALVSRLKGLPWGGSPAARAAAVESGRGRSASPGHATSRRRRRRRWRPPTPAAAAPAGAGSPVTRWADDATVAAAVSRSAARRRAALLAAALRRRRAQLRAFLVRRSEVFRWLLGATDAAVEACRDAQGGDAAAAPSWRDRAIDRALVGGALVALVVAAVVALPAAALLFVYVPLGAAFPVAAAARARRGR